MLNAATAAQEVVSKWQRGGPCRGLLYSKAATRRHQHTPYPKEILVFPDLRSTRVLFSLP